MSEPPTEANTRVNGETEPLMVAALAALLEEKALDTSQRGIAVAVDGAIDGDGDSTLAGVERLLLEERRKRRNHQRLGFTVDAGVCLSRRLTHSPLLFRSSSQQAKLLDPVL